MGPEKGPQERWKENQERGITDTKERKFVGKGSSPKMPKHGKNNISKIMIL